MDFEEQYKSLLEELVKIGVNNEYVLYEDIKNLFPDCSDELLDEVEHYLESKNIQVFEDEQDNDVQDEDVTNIDIEELESEEEPDDEDLQFEEDSEIKVSDFDSIDTSVYQSDDIVKMYLHEIGQKPLLTITQESELAKAVQDGLAAKETIASAEKNGKVIPEEKLKELNHIIFEGDYAKEELISSNLRLVVSVAKRYTNRGLPLADLIQEGNLGLIKAVDKFDPVRGWKFSTYATWWIRQAITRAIADKGRNVRVPVHMIESINRLLRTKRRLVQELHRDPTVEELAKEMKLSVEKIVELERVAQDSISFDSQVGDEDDSTLIDLIADDNTLNPLEYTEKRLFSEEIDETLQTLTPREEMVIRLRYGIGFDKPHTLEEVGKIMGVTRERVRQIESKATERLKKYKRISKLKEHL